MKKSGDYYGTSTPPVEHIELPDVKTKRRLAAVIILALIAVGSIIYIVWNYLTVEPGLQIIRTDGGESLADDFVLEYDFAEGETALYKQLTTLYGDAHEEAYKLFNSHKSFEGMNNLHVLNLNPNTEITLPPELYSALELLELSGSREHYKAPIFAEYSSIFFAEYDYEAEALDPDRSPEQAEFIEKLTDFALDPDKISLELSDGNRVKLVISDDYLAFAAEYGITDFVGPHWLENAFVTDYVAERLIDGGFTRGVLTSFDGFSRSLGDLKLSYRIFDRVGKTVTSAAIATLESGSSLVSLRDFPISLHDERLFYEYSDGSIVTRYIGNDGRDRSSIPALSVHSGEKSCAELLLELIPIYICEDFAPEKLTADFIYCEDYAIISSTAVKFSALESEKYRLK